MCLYDHALTQIIQNGQISSHGSALKATFFFIRDIKSFKTNSCAMALIILSMSNAKN